jgi:hypothetical protein
MPLSYTLRSGSDGKFCFVLWFEKVSPRFLAHGVIGRWWDLKRWGLVEGLQVTGVCLERDSAAPTPSSSGP